MEKYENWKKLKNLAQRIVTKEKYKNVKLRDAIETQARNSRVSTGHSSVAIHYSFNADTWREILEILEILQDYMQIA